MTTYTILFGQSLFDIAIEVYGHIDAVFWLLEDNPPLALTDRIRAGQSLFIRADKLDARQADELADFGPFQTIEETDKPIGIGYWRIDEYTISN